MQIQPGVYACLLLLSVSSALAASKPHSVALGTWTIVKWTNSDDGDKPTDLRVRPLLVDGRNKEWTIGSAHDVTERTFVVQRAYRLNDSLPQESGASHWRWERGAWLLVDRVTGKAQTLTLPDFDPYSSAVIWFRDYGAYCGMADDGKKQFAIVMQLGRRKALLKKDLATLPAEGGDACPGTKWDRNPSRVTFAPKGAPSFTYTIRAHAVDISPNDEDENAQ